MSLVCGGYFEYFNAQSPSPVHEHSLPSSTLRLNTNIEQDRKRSGNIGLEYCHEIKKAGHNCVNHFLQPSFLRLHKFKLQIKFFK